MSYERIGVIGGGAWGTALAQVAAGGGKPSLLWAREPEVVEAVNARHENHVFLPGVALNPGDPRHRRSRRARIVRRSPRRHARRSICARCWRRCPRAARR